MRSSVIYLQVRPVTQTLSFSSLTRDTRVYALSSLQPLLVCRQSMFSSECLVDESGEVKACSPKFWIIPSVESILTCVSVWVANANANEKLHVALSKLALAFKFACFADPLRCTERNLPYFISHDNYIRMRPLPKLTKRHISSVGIIVIGGRVSDIAGGLANMYVQICLAVPDTVMPEHTIHRTTYRRRNPAPRLNCSPFNRNSR